MQKNGAPGQLPSIRLKPEDIIKLAAILQLQQAQAGQTTGAESNAKVDNRTARQPQQQQQSAQGSSTERYAAMWTSVISGLLERYPGAGEAVTEFLVRNVGDIIGVPTAQAATNGLTAATTNGVASATTSGSTAAGSSGAQSLSAASGLQTAGNVMSGLAGLYSMYEGGSLVAAANQIGGVRGRQAGGMGGVTAAFGAGMAINALGLALGPVGWAGLLVGGLVAGGLIGSRLGDKDRWKTEGKRLSKLLEQGVQIPEEMLGAMSLARGRSKEELIDPRYAADFAGNTPHGFVNNKFANTRNEKDLHPEDIWGYAAFFEKFGNDWLGKFSEDQRRSIAQAALDSGAVREKHGTVNINWTPELEEKIKTSTLNGPSSK